jgi:hypothetical protein
MPAVTPFATIIASARSRLFCAQVLLRLRAYM